jgi:hypothetical protein
MRDVPGGVVEDLFELITMRAEEETQRPSVRLGLRLKVAGEETIIPISGPCDTFECLRTEVEALKNQLERMEVDAKEILDEPSGKGAPGIGHDMTAGEIWSVLKDIPDEAVFMKGFNGLDQIRRKGVAEYVLTCCNVFSGRASMFSARYNSVSGLLE